MNLFVDEQDENEPPKTETMVTIGVVPDAWSDRAQAQIVVSLAELKVMQRMVGGACLTNWLRLRGLLDEPFKES